MVTDQRFVDGRPDVLSWQTAPLVEDVVLAGAITAHLFVSTTGTDADFVAKLVDVMPEKVEGDAALGGAQIMVAAEILRGRFRKGFERPVPFTPGKGGGGEHRPPHPEPRLPEGAPRSWSRCRAPGSPSTTAIRRPSCRASSPARESDFRRGSPRATPVRHPSRVTFQAPD